MIAGFPPIAAPDARVLVLGTVPSVRSLEVGRYYAHPRNAFWPIMEALFAGRAALDHAARVELLHASRVAVWDVLAAAERPGSLDAAIVSATAVPNDLPVFLRAHRDVGTICFNGAAAERLFRAHISARLTGERHIAFMRLPSTSPANAAMSFEAKLAAWAVVRDVAEERG